MGISTGNWARDRRVTFVNDIVHCATACPEKLILIGMVLRKGLVGQMVTVPFGDHSRDNGNILLTLKKNEI